MANSKTTNLPMCNLLALNYQPRKTEPQGCIIPHEPVSSINSGFMPIFSPKPFCPVTDPQRSKCGQVTPATLESTIRSEKIDSCKLLDESPERAALFSPVHNALIDLAI
ncbi:hypothetical protein L3X38_029497 [Prunus dulcis]|uniref:Uncharacterized protein n=1 Tax=Prunus dulcis TaxID=3755 RepID=A0AAD4Z277_PRUDU|nr:hypothetical protein L3X38_029497 [Prunus dulcis]